jgi:hypothetical protein
MRRSSAQRTLSTKCPEIRRRRHARAGAAARAEKFVKVICSMQSGEYTRRKEYRFKQSSA